MRHAKSSWASPGLPDHQRPLNARGRRDAPRIARVLARLGWAPAHVHVSSAQRTTETWARMATELPPAEVAVQPSLYHGDLEAIFALSQTWAPDLAGPVLLLGHNPGWEAAVAQLGGTYLTVTTANAVLLRGSGTTWAEALSRTWTVEAHLKPRDLVDSEPDA